MDGRGIAWLGYIPIPGLGLVAALLQPESRLVRFHAWQASALVIATYVAMFLIGLLALLSEAKAYRTTIGLVSGLILIGALFQMGLGLATAALGRYVRLRPAWDLVALMRRA